MSDLQEFRSAPRSGPSDEQSGRPWTATQLKAGMAVTGRWLFEEMRGWHDRRMAAHELSRLLRHSVRGGHVRYP